jgi:hypothetical protein
VEGEADERARPVSEKIERRGNWAALRNWAGRKDVLRGC